MATFGAVRGPSGPPRQRSDETGSIGPRPSGPRPSQRTYAVGRGELSAAFAGSPSAGAQQRASRMRDYLGQQAATSHNAAVASGAFGNTRAALMGGQNALRQAAMNAGLAGDQIVEQDLARQQALNQFNAGQANQRYMQGRSLDSQRDLLAQELGLQRDLGLADIDLRRELGLGNLDLQRDLGMGDLDYRNRGLDLQRELGMGDLDYRNAALEQQGQLSQYQMLMQMLMDPVIGRALGLRGLGTGDTQNVPALADLLEQLGVDSTLMGSSSPYGSVSRLG